MILPIFQIDAFTDEVFGGSPACVIPLEFWLNDETLLKIAQENGVPETAFFVKWDNKIYLRWFTPDIEMDLCGHATLATAYCLRVHLKYPNDFVSFETMSGIIEVSWQNEEYFLNLPSRKPVVAELPEIICKSLSIQPSEVYRSRDYLLVYDNETEVRSIKINTYKFDQLNLDPGGVIVTAASQSEDCDFVYRFFTPQATVLEDPVTGSACCSLVPFWSKRLMKRKMRSIQMSDRGGKLKCFDMDNRVVIAGYAKTYLRGKINI